MKHVIFRRATALLAASALCVNLSGCAKESTSAATVPVQSVSMLVGLDIAGVNRYSGVAEPRSTEKIAKDSDKTVEECFVEVGQEVSKGDLLFRYDTEALELTVESARIEVEQLANSISAFDAQLATLRKEKASAGKNEKLSYTLQIQETELDKTEAEYNLKQKKAELQRLEKSTKDTDVKSPVDGVIQSISEAGSSGGYDDEYGGGSGGENTYITIMETGTYRIKGTVSEANAYLLYEEMPVTVLSRTDASQTWRGTISQIDTGSTEQSEDQQNYYDEGSSGESASRYSFYVTMEDAEGMMMGQHVYILPGEAGPEGALALSGAYIVDAESEPYVWACSSRDTLEKRSVTLGDYDELLDTYVIESGLTLEDYIAMPEDGLTEGAAVTKYDASSYSFGQDGGEGEDMGNMDTDPMDYGDSSMGEMDFAEEEYTEEAYTEDGADTEAAAEDAAAMEG